MPIAQAVLPDGRVLGYGTNSAGFQGATMQYAVWDRAAGTNPDAFNTLPNTVGTDIFCGAQTIESNSGKVLLIGGDARSSGIRNYATNDVNLFDPTTNTLVSAKAKMAYKRWYATAVSMPSGEQVVLGGRIDRDFAGTTTAPATTATYASRPEFRSLDGTWRALDAVVNEFAYGSIGSSWNYPRAWVKPDGNVFILAHSGLMFTLNTTGAGTLVRHSVKASASVPYLPSVMFSPGRILSLRLDGSAITVDINGKEPVVTPTGSPSAVRHWSNATVLADGKVLLTGGSGVPNELVSVTKYAEIWNPATGMWSKAASAAEPRLYHSSAVLLPDGTVSTGGGGAPGPITQLNGEIYYPTYLFRKNGSGEFVERPRILKIPQTILGWAQTFTLTVSGQIVKATLVRHGTATHSFDNDARFFELPVSYENYRAHVTTPSNPQIAPPGYYMLFLWNQWGIPSVAATIKIG